MYPHEKADDEEQNRCNNSLNLHLAIQERKAEQKLLNRFIKSIAFFTFFVVATCVLSTGRNEGLPITVTLNTKKIVHNTSDKFLSVALDTSLIQERWTHLNITSKKLLEMVQHLSPAYLRVGGTTADRLIFSNSSVVPPQSEIKDESRDWNVDSGPIDGDNWSYEANELNKTIANFTMTSDDWIMINKFSKNAGLSLLFDLNVLLRDGDAWNSENARQLIQFSNEHGFNLDWQLGNEPNSFPFVFNVDIPGYQLGKDFVTLKDILLSYPRYSKSLLVGPDVTRPKFIKGDSIRFLKEFLMSAYNSIDAVTWHQYYLDGHVAELSDFLKPATLNLLYKQIHAVQKAVKLTSYRVRSNPRIWLTETSSAYGGGAAELSDRFVAGFLWLDKLGVAARSGIDVVVRQSLYHGYYSLLDEKTLNPLPDWWLSVLFKTFVGPGVIETSTFLGATRIYCHCTPLNVVNYSHGTVTIFGLNMRDEYVDLDVCGLPTPLPNSYASAYILTGDTGLQSKYVRLNGKRLSIGKGGSLPPFKPHFIEYSSPLTMPPYSMAFFVMHGVPVPACKG